MPQFSKKGKTLFVSVPRRELSLGFGVTEKEALKAYGQGFKESARGKNDVYADRGISRFIFRVKR